MYFKACSKCKEYLSEDDMFPKLKNGKNIVRDAIIVQVKLWI